MERLKKHLHNLESEICLQKLRLSFASCQEVEHILRNIWNLSLERETLSRFLATIQVQSDSNCSVSPVFSTGHGSLRCLNMNVAEIHQNCMHEQGFLEWLHSFCKEATHTPDKQKIVTNIIRGRLQYLEEIDRIQQIFK
jgi:hypothetical protein